MNKSDRLDELLTIAIREVILEDWEAMTSAQGIQPVSRKCGERMERILSGRAKRRGTFGKIGIGILVALTAFALLGMAIPPVREAIVRVFFTWQDTDYGVMKLGDGDAFIQVVGSRVYCYNTETGRIGSYPREASEEPVFREIAVPDPAETPEAMFADGTGFALVYRDRLLLLDGAGNSVGETENILFDPAATYNRFSVCKNDDSVLLGVLRVYGQGLEAAYRGAFLTWDPQTGAVKETECAPAEFVHIAAENGRFLILARLYDPPSTLLELELDPGSGALTERGRFYDNGSYTWYDGSMYGFRADPLSFYRFFRVNEDGSEEKLKNIRPGFLADAVGMVHDLTATPFSMYTIFYDDRGLAVADPIQRILLLLSVSPAPSGDTLRVLYPVHQSADWEGFPQVGNVQAAFADFEERENARIAAKGVDSLRFSEHLRQTLLAGDAEFDVVHADKCDRGDLLFTILQNGFYLPLEEEKGILGNYENFADGVKEYMTWDGHLIGIPFRFETRGFVITEAYLDAGLPVPDTGWTLDDFWDICEEAKPFVDSRTALTETDSLYLFMEALIQSGGEKGRLDEDAILSAAEKLLLYDDAGLFRPFEVNTVYLLENRVRIPACPRDYAQVEVKKALPMPLIDGERICPLESFVWAYRNAENPTLAVRYLEMITSEDYIYNLEGRTCFGKDPDRYFRIITLWEDVVGTNVRIKADLSEKDLLMIGKTSELMTDMKLEILDHADAETVIRPLLDRMFAGELSAEDAAGEIIRYAKREYFE